MNRVTFAAIPQVLALPPPVAGVPGLFSLADTKVLGSKLPAAGFSEIKTEALVVRAEFGSVDEYVRLPSERCGSNQDLLVTESPERRGEVWRAVAGANAQFIGTDGKLHVSGESVLVTG